MKIAYIGASDGLAEALTARLGQEGHDVYLLSDKALSQKGSFRRRFYRIPGRGESFHKLVCSIAPDCIIFAGTSYMELSQGEDPDENVTLLSRTLRAAATFPRVRFILLSSTEVYGAMEGKADEGAERAAARERGIRFVREEQLLHIYLERYNMDTAILRVSQLYTDRAREGAGDFLSGYFTAAAGKESHMPGGVFQPIHVADFADAVKRAMESDKQLIYNVCGSEEISAEYLYRLICQQGSFPEQAVLWEEPRWGALADNSRIKEELGWRDFRNLKDQLHGGEITYEQLPKEKRKRKLWAIPAGIRQSVENLLIFACFFALHSLCRSNDLFSQLNWLMVYVILISVSYNTHQSILAATLASAAYLYSQNLSILEMRNFHAYAGGMLEILEFVSMGLIISYTISVCKEEVLSIRLNLEMLREEHEELKAINAENVIIKNEYEERLLTSKTGFPKLYSLVSRLMAEEPDRIFMETLQVISELIRTDTVAVYRVDGKSPWLRLVNARNDASTMNGKTWNLSGFPLIYTAVMEGELYQGEPGSDEPAVVLPILCHDQPQAVILIRTLPYESETLYHVNLLKTMSLLLRDCMEKALQYEELSRSEQYVEGTEILKDEAFRKRILLAQEKAEKSFAEYCVVELAYPGTLEEAASAVEYTIRTTDYLGTDGTGTLFALLNNTGAGDLEYLQKRLDSCGVTVINRTPA